MSIFSFGDWEVDPDEGHLEQHPQLLISHHRVRNYTVFQAKELTNLRQILCTWCVIVVSSCFFLSRFTNKQSNKLQM